MAAAHAETYCSQDQPRASIPPLPDSPDPELGLYKYSPLSQATLIRLLEVHPSPPGEIYCSLTIADLDDNPIFDALSYTWGNPITLHDKPEPRSPLEELQDLALEVELGNREESSKHKICIDFDAFAYRCQNPFLLYEKVVWEAERCCPIKCNEKTLLVTENLLHALLFWRRLVMGEVEGGGLEVVSGTSRSKYIWIGAICINQEDIEERHAQVSVMRRIYGQASCVLGWFGKEDRTSRRAFRTLHKLLLHSFTQWQPNQAFFLWTFGDINEADWMALFALLQRLWFRRIWIVQEAVFAQRLIIVCGGVMIHWFGVQKCLKFLKETQLDENLGNFAKALIYGGPSNRYIQKLQLAGVALWGISHKQHALPAKLLANPRDPFTFIAGIQYIRDCFGATEQLKIGTASDEAFENVLATDTNLSLNHNAELCQDRTDTPYEIDDIEYKTAPPMAWLDSTSGRRVPVQRSTFEHEVKKRLSPLWTDSMTGQRQVEILIGPSKTRKPVSLIHLLSAFRNCGASDPRDKVFALLGIALQNKSPPSETIHLKPDYHEPVQEVYRRTAEFILKSYGNLALLSHVQDPSLTHIPDLPTWVPDFSVSLGRTPFENEEQNHWRASGDHSSSGNLTVLGYRLFVSGVLLDKIAHPAPSKGCYFVRTGLTALMTNIASNPTRYLTRLEKECVLLPGFLTGECAPLSLPIFPKAATTHGHDPIKCSTLVEALWRTMTADYFNDQHPAPIRCGFGFSDWVSNKMARAVSLTSFSQNGTLESGKSKLKESLEHKTKIWEILSKTERGGYYALAEIEATKKAVQKYLDEIYQVELEINLEAGGYVFFRIERGWIRLLSAKHFKMRLSLLTKMEIHPRWQLHIL